MTKLMKRLKTVLIIYLRVDYLDEEARLQFLKFIVAKKYPKTNNLKTAPIIELMASALNHHPKHQSQRQMIQILDNASMYAFKEKAYLMDDKHLEKALIEASGKTELNLYKLEMKINKGKVLKSESKTLLSFKEDSYTPWELRHIGFPMKEIKDSGFDLKAFLDSGFGGHDLNNKKIVALKEAGFTAAELKKAGFTLNEIMNADYELKQIQEAGYDLKTLKDAGYDLTYLTKKGYDLKAIYNAGYKTEALQTSGYSIKDFKNNNYKTKDLKNAGYDFNRLGLTDYNYSFSYYGNPIESLSA
ncbi:hypothetical protein AshY1_01700 [Candidatus Phytoplasma fraxini]|uniref:Uncharacterized protein n=2 Tax=Ash yellows phytoplasma TaxID=35780 RepID=A0ABZ2U9G6_ASHYP